MIFVNNNNNNFISIALLSYVQGALQSCKQHETFEKYLQPYPIIFKMSKKGKKKLKLKQLLNHLTEYIQIYKNNDPLLLNLVNKYVLSDLLKLEMVLDFRIS